MKQIDKVKNWLQHDLKSDQTYKTYMETIQEFNRKYGLEDLSESTVSDYLMNEKSDLKHTSKARHLYALKKVEKPLLLYDIIGVEVKWDRIPNITQSYDKKFRSLSKEELKTLIDNAVKYRDKAMVLVGFDLALRVSEMAQIKHSDLVLGEGTIDLSRVKGGEKKIWELSDRTVDALKEYIDNGYTGHKYVFDVTPTRLNQCFKKLGEKTGVAKKGERFGLHILRHTRATLLAERGWDIDSIREFLGQKSINATEKYIHTAPERLSRMKKEADEDLKELL